MYVQNVEFLSRAQEIYPGAFALEVDRLGAVWVRCDPCQWDHRDIPGGAVRLGSSPTTAALEREILAFLKD
jgi:hypothetical protein